jgi:transcriptional regulator with XRE-family HTH domain
MYYRNHAMSLIVASPARFCKCEAVFAWASFATGDEMPKKRGAAAAEQEPRWNASQLVAFNLGRARAKAGMTQQEAAEAISKYTESEWTQATVATAEASVTGARIRQFSPAELLAFCFAFDVPVGWFFMPPPDDENIAALEMPKHSSGIGWDWVFRRTTPTDKNIDEYLFHQGDWGHRSKNEPMRVPFHHRFGEVFRGAGTALSDDELQRYFLLGYLRRGLGGSMDLRRQTSWGEAKWFEEASALMSRMAALFAAIGPNGPSPSHVMRQKDLEDARWITEEIERKRAEAGRPICAECFQHIELSDPSDGTSWVHINEDSIVRKHPVVA